MAIAQVGNWTSVQFANSTGGALTGRTSTAGNFVGIGYSTDQTSSPTITHSQAGSVQIGKAHESISGADKYGTRYIENIAGGASHTITLTTSAGQFSALHATEYSGMATSSTLDKTASGTGTDTSNTFDLTSSATTTTAQADELLIGVGGIATNHNAGASAWSGQSSFTVRGMTTDGSNSSVSCLVDRIVAATGTYSSAARLTDAGGLAGGSGAWLIQIVTFKGAASGNATATPSNLATPFSFPAPTIQAGAIPTPTNLSTPFTIRIPTVLAGATTTPSALATPFSFPGATVTAGATTTPSNLATPFSFPAPTITTGTPDVTVTPGNLATPFSFPSAGVTANAVVTPNALATNFSFPSATITGTALEAAANLATPFAFPSPTVSGAALVTPSNLATPFSFPAMTVTTDGSVTVSASRIQTPFTFPAPSPSGTGGTVVDDHPGIHVPFRVIRRRRRYNRR